MSLKENYLQHINTERTRLRDAVIPIEVKSKPQREKLCTFCKRDMMEPYLRPPNRFIDENGLDNGGMKPNTWYYKCPTCGEHYEMPTQAEGPKRGYKQKNPVTSKLPMRRPGLLSNQDAADVQAAFGTTDGVSLVDEREYTYSEGGFS